MNATLKLTLSMFIFGTIGIFRRYIPLPSSMVAMTRGIVGMLVLLAFLRLKRVKLDRKAICKNAPILILSGAAMGVNWILLFEAYNYTSVATATLCYYLAPIVVMLVSPFVLDERLTARKSICILTALAGMVFVSGVNEGAAPAAGELRGILMGLGAACLYAAVVLLNKRVSDIEALDRTVVQLGVSCAVLAPYIFLTEDVLSLMAGLTPVPVLLLVFVAVVHTGIAYALYFSSIRNISAQTAALFSYVDPVVAILLSAFFLGERMPVSCAVGAVMILGSALVSELPGKSK